ncbi:hypothetical protein SY2F82_74210 [Streptomyces sp. Y2F8-2]|uniref:hypothetical protein n=1 Tax=Streptomyces sp. Y2F8-2 TaxID=2759675 RepID=UPI001A529DC2|nr:hypothetical protein [Streptomyces sp. Y2F8-2]GHK05624.1 hypothetical protein SY2F82_74210 [Streptomyces sp. Y2F8-2]
MNADSDGRPQPVWSRTQLAGGRRHRLTFNGTIIETGIDSDRIAMTRARAEESSKAD